MIHRLNKGEYRVFGIGGPTLATIIARLIVLIIAFPAHEGAHAVVADRLGDPTPRRAGRITLNPLKHLDVLGSFLFLYAGFGWATTPISPYYLGRRGMAIVSLAGPVANLLVAFLLIIPARIILSSPQLSSMFGNAEIFPSLGRIMSEMIGLNVLLFVFNLIPLPPLDGYRIVLGLLPFSLAQSFQRIERYGPLILMAIIFLVPRVLFSIINPIRELVIAGLLAFARLLGF